MAEQAATAAEGPVVGDEQRKARVLCGRAVLEQLAFELEDLPAAMRECSDEKAEKFWLAISSPLVARALFDGLVPLARGLDIDPAEIDAVRAQLEAAIANGGGR